MNAVQKPLVVRVTGIETEDLTQAEFIVQRAIARQYTNDEAQIPKYEIATVPCCDGFKNCDALLDFSPGQLFPSFLARLQQDPLASVTISCDEGGKDYITFDCHFHGFTQLYPVPEDQATLDIIAITGLDGHAYGSWRAKQAPWHMWLRHFLQKDLPYCRTMIYGYNSKLSSRRIGTIMDYGREFLEKLKSVRNSKEQRPVIFVAHSFGGIILAHCLIKAIQTDESVHPAISSLYKATHSIFFFGTPHTGLLVDDIRRMIENTDQHPQNDLLEEITLQSNLLKYQLDDFKNLIHDRKIVSFYETQQTRRLERNPKTQGWSRTGSYMTAVESGSALLSLPDNIEIKINVDADHSSMVKFDSRTTGTYKQAINYLREFHDCASNVVFQRFGSSPEKRTSFSTVPFARDPAFVGREDSERRHILQYLEERVTFESHTRIAIVGVGGVGKSQVVIEYSYRIRARNPRIWVFWIYAASPERIEQSFRSIAAKLSLPGHDDPRSNIFLIVSQWLSSDNGKWVIILDNADDINILRRSATSLSIEGGQAQSFLNFIPQASNGALVITTRDKRAAYQICGSTENIIHMDSMNDAEAIQLLQTKLPRENHDALRELAAELDRIPLAMSQAAAYISIGTPRTTVEIYLNIYRREEESQRKLLEKDYGELRRDISVPNSVTRTWKISFDQIRRDNSQAANLLSVMAAFDRQGIPEMLLSPIFQSQIDFEDALTPLLSFSLILNDSANKTFGMHRLIQLATRKWLDDLKLQEEFQGKALVLLKDTMPTGYFEDWETCRLLYPHASEVLQSKHSSEVHQLARADLLYSLAWYNTELGREELAHELCSESVSICERLLGPNHQKTLRGMSLILANHLLQNQFEEALPLGEKALARSKKELGSDHAQTLDIMGHMVWCYRALGQNDKAVRMAEKTVKKAIKIFGTEHSDTLGPMNNLTTAYASQGRYEEAIELGGTVLEKATNLLGAGHPRTLISMENLSGILKNCGRLDEALNLLEKCAVISTKSLGTDHPDTENRYVLLEAWTEERLKQEEQKESGEKNSRWLTLPGMTGTMGQESKKRNTRWRRLESRLKRFARW